MARDGQSVAAMFHELKTSLGANVPIVTILDHLRTAFCLSRAEVKPVAALSRNGNRDIEDAARLEELMQPGSQQHRREWDNATNCSGNGPEAANGDATRRSG